MLITVQVAERTVAAASTTSRDSQAQSATSQLARAFGVEFHPMHPGSADAALASYFSVEAPEGAQGERLLQSLRESPLIAAAYVKPPDAMP